MAVLTGLITLKDDLSLLDAKDCPYDGETVDTLKRLLAPEVVEKVVEREVQVPVKAGRGRPSKDVHISGEDQQMIIDEIKNQIAALNNITGSVEVSEKIAISKSKIQLVDSLLKMQERWTASKRMEEFMENVMTILNDLVSEADRAIFLRRLEDYR